MPLVAKNSDRQFVNVFPNTLAMPVRVVNPSASSTLIALQLKFASTRNVAILVRDSAATTPNAESSIISLRATARKDILAIRWNLAGSFRLKWPDQHNRQWLKSASLALRLRAV